MIYKNIDIHNVAEVIEDEKGGVRWLRVPQSVYDKMESEQGQRMCRGATGVELRFVMKGDKAVVKLACDGSSTVTVNVFFGGVQAGWQCYGESKTLFGDAELVIQRPEKPELLKDYSLRSGYDFSPEVVRVIFSKGSCRLIDVEGDVCPPEKDLLPKKTILAYGSSITHGSNSLAMSNNWTSVLAHNLNSDLINLGMAGSCRMEPEMIDHIASLGESDVWTTALLELGINVLSWDEETIRQRVGNALRQVAGRNPTKRVYVISPLYCHNDYYGREDANKWRRLIADEVEKTAYPNVRYINGLELLGDVSGLSADEVHPNIYGILQIATRLTEIIK